MKKDVMKTIEGTSVQTLVKRQYADEVDDGKGGKRKSAMAGKSYWICASELGRFVVEDGSSIHKAIESGELWNITLEDTDDGLQYITHTTQVQVVNRARGERELQMIRNFKVNEVTPDDLIQ